MLFLYFKVDFYFYIYTYAHITSIYWIYKNLILKYYGIYDFLFLWDYFILH